MSHRVSDRGEQMKHRSKNLHERHMSDIRGAVGCYYCWLGQYSKCKNSCHLVRVTDRDHSMAQSGGAADHRDVLYRWDHAAPVLTHAAQQSNSFYNIPAPKEASVWVNSASGMGKQHLTKNDFISVTRHVPEDKPWITSSRADQNRSMLKSISQNIHQAEIDRAERHRAKHEHKLFSLLLPEQFIAPYKYPHGSVTVQATPYTQIAMKQPRNKNNNNSTRARSSSPNTTYNHELNNSYRAAGGNVMYSFNDDYLEQIEDARAAATEQRRQTQAMLRGANRPVFMHTRHGGRYVTADSSIYNGGEVLRKGATSDDTPAKQLRRAEEDFIAAQNYGTHNASHVLSTAEQLRAALEGRSITQMRDDRVVALRARSAGVGHRERGLGGGGGTRNEPSVRMEETSGHVLSGRYTNAMTMPMPESFAF